MQTSANFHLNETFRAKRQNDHSVEYVRPWNWTMVPNRFTDLRIRAVDLRNYLVVGYKVEELGLLGYRNVAPLGGATFRLQSITE